MAVNEIVNTVEADWYRLDSHRNHTALDYAVLDESGRVLFQTAEHISSSIHAAIRHHVYKSYMDFAFYRTGADQFPDQIYPTLRSNMYISESRLHTTFLLLRRKKKTNIKGSPIMSSSYSIFSDPMFPLDCTFDY